MKKYLPVLSLAFLVAACNTQPETTGVKTLQSAQQAPMDTAGLAQFQQWKAQNELSSPAPVQQQTVAAQTAPVKTVEVIREVRVEKPAPVRKKAVKQTEESPAPVPTPSTTPSTTADAGTAGGTANSTSANEAKAPETAKKEGWSKAAKGATIGAAGGAVVGAVINKKNPAVGAVIGGVLGAGVGYGIGHGKDKKDGRY